jgi:hypothetical protein
MGQKNPDKLNRTPTKPTQDETQNITPANNKTESKESTKGEKKHMSDQESDEAPSEDESIEDNTTHIEDKTRTRLRKVKKAEEQKKKLADKAWNVQVEEMKRMLTHVEQGVEKRITERLAEQKRKHDKDLKALKQSQAATKNMLMSNNPTEVISCKAA